jgi:methionine-rich copper-binding protein CopC
MYKSFQGLKIILTIAFVFGGASLCWAGPYVVSTLPAQNALDVAVGTNIDMAFNEDVISVTFNDLTLFVYGSLSGRHSGAISYDFGTHTVTLNPTNDFITGEIVTVIITTEILSFMGEFMDTSYIWSFIIESGDGPGTFALDTSYAAGVAPLSACAADFDGDGDFDIAATNIMSDSISVYLNNGSGKFAPQIKYRTSDGPAAIFAADLDGDQDFDIVTADWYADSISVLKNNGNGTFAIYSAYETGMYPTAVEGADLDGDGDIDLAVANWFSNDVSILLNQGTGVFVLASTSFPVGSGPLDLCLGDFDSDADIDIATANSGSDDVSLLLNYSDGTFADDLTFGVGDYPSALSVADFDGDGNLDIATVNTFDNNTSVLINNGDSTFAVGVNYSAGIGPEDILAADLDGDGYSDLAVGNTQSGSISRLVNIGTGAFDSHRFFLTDMGPRGIAYADFDGDSDLDLVTVNDGNSNTISVLINTIVTDVESPDDLMPADYALGQNYPNPFNPLTYIGYSIGTRCRVTISVFNLLGKKVSTLVDEEKPAGTYTAQWYGTDRDGRPVASGVYLYQIKAGEFVESKKMLLLK